MTAEIVGPGGTVFIDPSQLPLPVVLTSPLWFTWAQGTPEDVWEIDHPLPANPSVTVENSAHQIVEPDITYAAGHITLDFGGVAYSGWAYLS